MSVFCTKLKQIYWCAISCTCIVVVSVLVYSDADDNQSQAHDADANHIDDDTVQHMFQVQEEMQWGEKCSISMFVHVFLLCVIHVLWPNTSAEIHCQLYNEMLTDCCWCCRISCITSSTPGLAQDDWSKIVICCAATWTYRTLRVSRSTRCAAGSTVLSTATSGTRGCVMQLCYTFQTHAIFVCLLVQIRVVV